MKIYLTRHGETLWNTEGRMQGWQNSDLTEKGMNNAKKLGFALKDVNFDAVYCSPAGRALQTTECIIGNKTVEIIKTDYLKEMCFGVWEGMTHDEVERLYPKEKYNLWNNPEEYIPIEGETFNELISRVKYIVNEIINTPNLENVLIVSHAITIKAVYAVIKNYSFKEFWNPPFLNDTCLSIIEVNDGQPNFILEADISHLDIE